MQRIQRIDILKVSEKEMKVEKGNFPNKWTRILDGKIRGKGEPKKL